MSDERDGSYYGKYRPASDELNIQEWHPQKEDENNQTRFRWFWDDPRGRTQTFCGQWKASYREAREDGLSWLRSARR